MAFDNYVPLEAESSHQKTKGKARDRNNVN